MHTHLYECQVDNLLKIHHLRSESGISWGLRETKLLLFSRTAEICQLFYFAAKNVNNLIHL
jgi:hypothetical protein